MKHNHARCRHYRVPIRVGALCAFVALSMAFTWPWDVQAQKKTDQKKIPQTVQRRVDEISKQAAASYKVKETAEKKHDLRQDMKYTGAEPPALPESAKVPKIPHFEVPGRDIKVSKPTLPDFSKMVPAQGAGRSGYLPVNRSVSTTPPVREQLDEIIKLNESLKRQSRGDAAQLQKIAAEAEMHKRLLDELEKTRTTRAISVPPDTSELIRQEKIKLIRAEAQQNYDYLSKLKEARDAAKAKK